jgi:hypothetical protein
MTDRGLRTFFKPGISPYSSRGPNMLTTESLAF